MRATKPAIPRRLIPLISDQRRGAFCNLLDQLITDIDSYAHASNVRIARALPHHLSASAFGGISYSSVRESDLRS